MLIKLKNNIATRESLPSFLAGLAPESLRDLSWTDPQLGVQDSAWWPERDDTPPLPEGHTFDDTETLTIQQKDGVVSVVRGTRALTAEEIEAAWRAANPVPASVTRRQARQALLLAGLLPSVQPAINAIPDPTERGMAQIEWDDSQAFERHRPLLISLGYALGLDDAGLDALFVQAAAL